MKTTNIDIRCKIHNQNLLSHFSLENGSFYCKQCIPQKRSRIILIQEAIKKKREYDDLVTKHLKQFNFNYSQYQALQKKIQGILTLIQSKKIDNRDQSSFEKIENLLKQYMQDCEQEGQKRLKELSSQKSSKYFEGDDETDSESDNDDEIDSLYSKFKSEIMELQNIDLEIMTLPMNEVEFSLQQMQDYCLPCAQRVLDDSLRDLDILEKQLSSNDEKQLKVLKEEPSIINYSQKIRIMIQDYILSQFHFRLRGYYQKSIDMLDKHIQFLQQNYNFEQDDEGIVFRQVNILLIIGKAGSLLQLGKTKEAQEILEKNIELMIDNQSSPYCKIMSNLLTQCDYQNSKIDIAINFGEHSLQEYQKQFPKNGHPDMIQLYITLANCYNSQNKFKDAMKCVKSAIDIRNSWFSDDPQITLGALNILFGRIFLKQNSSSEAFVCFNKGIDILQSYTFNRSHPEIGHAQKSISTIYKQKGVYETAREYLKRAKSVYIEFYGETDKKVADIYNQIGLTYSVQKSNQKALDQFLKAYYIQKQSKGSNDIDKTMAYIGQTYQALGDFEKAAEYFELALAQKIKVYGENSINTQMTRVSLSVSQKNLGEYKKAAKNSLDVLNYFEKNKKIKEIQHYPLVMDTFFSSLNQLQSVHFLSLLQSRTIGLLQKAFQFVRTNENLAMKINLENKYSQIFKNSGHLEYQNAIMKTNV